MLEKAFGGIMTSGAAPVGPGDKTQVTPMQGRNQVKQLLAYMIGQKASDLHLVAGSAPRIRLHTRLIPIPRIGSLSPEGVRALAYSMLSDRQKAYFEQHHFLDAGIELTGELAARFRMHVFSESGRVACTFRHIPTQIPTLQQLHLPAAVGQFTSLDSGLVLVSGRTGSGKSTTQAAMIDRINSSRECRIVTVEAPIEYVHRHNKALISQREVGADTDSFPAALRDALREDPDVVLVGEMRDMETISGAVTIAETGHLVLSTLHCTTAPQAIDRIADAFSGSEKDAVRATLATVLRGVVAQKLLPTKDGKGVVAAVEILVANSAVRNLVRAGKTEQLASAIETGGQLGMISFEACLRDLVRRDVITREVALEFAENPDSLRTKLP